jgi:hypothetical protein
MKVILDIEESREKFFMELLQSLDYVKVIKQVKNEQKSQQLQDLVEAFNDVKLHEQGKKQLKTAKDLLIQTNNQ